MSSPRNDDRYSVQGRTAFVRPVFYSVLYKASAREDRIVDGDDLQPVAALGREDHAAALDAHHFAGREVRDIGDVLADKLLGRVILRDPREDDPLALAVVQGEFQELLTLFYLLAREHLRYPQLDLLEIVKGDLGLVFGQVEDRRFRFLRFIVLDDGVELFDLFIDVDTGEDRLAAVYRDIERQYIEFVGVLIRRGAGREVPCADLFKDLRHGGRHERGQQGSGDTDGFEQVVEHGRQPRLLRLILAQNPRGSLVDIFIRAGYELEDFFQREVELGVFDIGVNLRLQRGGDSLEVVVKIACFALGRQGAAEVLVDHRDGTGDEVAQSVGEIGVDAVDHDLVREGAVRAQRHFAHDVVADCVYAVALTEDERVDHVAEGFTHLLTVEGDPAVDGKMLRQRLLERHQHRRPDDRVEAHDILGDHMHIGGPVLVIVGKGAVLIAQGGDIVRQRVDPDIDDVLGVKGDGDSPAERGARYAQILQTIGFVAVFINGRLQEVVDQFGRAGARTQIIGLGQELFDPLGKGSHLEEVGFLLRFDDLSATVRAFAVNQLALGPEALAGGAVFAGVFALVDIAAVVQLLEDMLYALDVIVVGGADIAVIADVHILPQLLKYRDDLIDILLGGDAAFLRLFLYLLTVFIGAGQEHHVIALHPLIPRDAVARDGGIGVPDMGVARGIIDRGGDVKRLFCTFLAHGCSLLFIISQRGTALAREAVSVSSASAVMFRRIPYHISIIHFMGNCNPICEGGDEG